MKKTIVEQLSQLRDKMKLIESVEGMPESDIDYDQVLEAIAALYGPAIWSSDSMQDLAGDLEQENPTPDELAFIIKHKQLPPRLEDMLFTNNNMSEGEDDEDDGHSDWQAKIMDKIDAYTFEVRITNNKTMQTFDYAIRPVEMIQYSGNWEIDSMDVRDLQTGKTASWANGGVYSKVVEYIYHAISQLFWDTPELQRDLQTIVDNANERDEYPKMMPGITKRNSVNAGSVLATDVLGSDKIAQDAIKRAQQSSSKKR